jgi:hypothetical protein
MHNTATGHDIMIAHPKDLAEILLRYMQTPLEDND